MQYADKKPYGLTFELEFCLGTCKGLGLGHKFKMGSSSKPIFNFSLMG